MTIYKWMGRLLFLVLAHCVQTEAAFGGPIFFSVDRSSDELVQIDAATGHVSVIGSLGFDALDVDLARVGNRLYALNSSFQVRVDLHEINPTTGASLSSSQVQTASGAVTSAEGLAQISGQLKIGYSTAGNAFSNALGDLALNGAITNTQTGNPQLDFDGLGADPVSMTLYGFDRFPPGSATTVDFFTVNQSPLTITVFKTVSSTFVVNDVAVSGNTLYAIDNINRQLHDIDLATNAFSSVNLDRNGTYIGLAIPEPSSFALWAIAVTVLVCYGSGRTRYERAKTRSHAV